MFKDKNILFITHSYRNWVKDRIESIADNFNKIYVLVRYKPISKIGVLFNSNIFKMHTKEMVFDMNCMPSNVKVIPVPLWYLPTNNGYLNLGENHFKAVKRILKKGSVKFDIIHAHFAWSAGYVGMKLKKDYNVPLVITTHAYDVNDLPFRSIKWKKLIQNVLSEADHVITVSHKNKQYIDKINISSPVTIIPNGYRNIYFYPKNAHKSREKLGLPLGIKIILSVGNLEEIKGHKFLINAIKIISNNYRVLCIIVGEGSYRKKLNNQIRINNLRKSVCLVGFKYHHDIVDWINACDVFVLPSINEGNPTVMFESMACGKPIVSTRVGGVPEHILSDDYGLMVKPENSEQLAEAIIEALNKDWDRNKIISNSIKYNWENLCSDKLQIYNNLFVRRKINKLKSNYYD